MNPILSRVGKLWSVLYLLLIAVGVLSQNAAFAASQTRNGATCTSLGGGGANWTTPGLAASSDNANATASVDGTTTDPLQCLNYGFSIPAGATILGIEVKVERRSSVTPGSEDASVRLVQGGTIAGSDLQTATAYTTADVIETHGSPTELWGLTWTPADINAANFGVAFTATKPAGAGAAQTISVDQIQIVVYYNQPPPAPDLSSPADAATVTTGAPVFDWTDVADPDGDTVTYDIQADNSGCAFPSPEVNTASLAVSTFTLGSALADGTYCWRARAVDQFGLVGPWSTTRNVTINTVSAFDAVEVAAAVATAIKTRISGANFSLDVVAVKSGVVHAGYLGTLTVEIVDAATGGGVCAAMTQLQDLGSHIFAAGDSGRKTISTFNYANASPNARVRIIDSSVSVTSCSFDNFAIRPNSLSFTVTDGDWETAGTTRTLNNASTPGGTVHKAGRPLTITATAYNGAGSPAITTNYAGTPTASIVSHIIPTSCLNGTACTLDGGTFTDGTANDGIVSSATASYAEVGAFNMQLTDTSFADVDVLDSSTAQRYITSGSVAVGRFVPDHFALSSGSRTPACTIGGSVLSYMGQPFTLAATLVAQNFAASITENYHPASGGYAPAAVVWQVENADSGTDLTARLINASAAWSNGSYVVNSTTATFNRLAATTPDGPYDSLQLGVQITDPDGPVLGGLDMNAATSGACAPCTTKAVGAPISARYGRLRLLNAYGSELLPLRMPVRAEYFNGTTWTLNAADNCTSLLANAFALSGGIAANTSASAVTLSGGNGTLILAKPSPVAPGSVDVAVNLGASGSDQSCLGSHGGTFANMPWLRGFWAPPANCNGTAAWAQDPNVRVKFGASKAPYIYLRERF